MSTRTIRLPIVLAAFAVTTACAGNPTEAPPGGFADPEDEDGSSSGPRDEPLDESEGPGSGPTTDPTSSPDLPADDDGSESSGEPAGVAQIRFVHAATDAPNVDVYLEGSTEPLISDLAYGGASDHVEIAAGSVVVEIRTAGASADDPPTYSVALDLEDDTSVTAVAAGVLDSDDEADAFRVLPLVEAFADPGDGNAAIRFVHAGVDADPIAVDIDHDGSDAEISYVARFGDSGIGGVTMHADSAVQLGLVAGGEELTAFTTPTLAEGGNVFLIATGRLDDLPREATGFGLIAVGPTGLLARIRQNPIVYSLHASPDSGRFDVCIDDVAFATSQGFGELARIQLRPGAYDLEFFPQNGGCTGEPANVQPSGELVAGEQYLLVSAGEIIPEAEDQPFQTHAFVDAFPLHDESEAAFAVIHAGSAPDVDFGMLDEGDQVTPETLLIADLAWAEQSEVLMLAPDNYSVGFVPASTPLPAAPYGVVPAPMSQGMRAWMVAAGDVSPQGYDHVATVITIVTSANPWVVVPL